VPIDLLLLLALPASGKSELRRYLAHLPADVARRDMHLGPTIQVDDYPYVHLMRRISTEQRRLGLEPAFFIDDEAPFRDPADWLTLTHLLAEDVMELGQITSHPVIPEPWLERLGTARARAGIGSTIATDQRLIDAIAPDTNQLASELAVVTRDQLADATVVVEFARGGPDGATPPLPAPLGYAASLAALGEPILERASILWVVADPAESRRRNRERARPGPEGDASILHHGVPEAVMLHDYGMDDLEWLTETSPVPGTVAIGDGDLRSLIPIARFDNRIDRTSFLRADPDSWPPGAVAALHHDLAAALGALATGSGSA
jgi:hypothetical protein